MSAGNPIRTGIIGCGQMGSGLAHTINNIRGMQVQAIADIELERARRTLIDIGIPESNIHVTEQFLDTRFKIEDNKITKISRVLMFIKN